MKKQAEAMSAQRLMNYRIALALVDRIANECFLTAADREKLYTILAKKYGIDSGSIFLA